MDESVKVVVLAEMMDLGHQVGVAYSLERKGIDRMRYAVKFDIDGPEGAVGALKELAAHLERQLI